MEHSTATPEKAKKAPATKGKTQVGRPGPAANESLPIPLWVLPMQSILKKLADLAMAGMEVVDIGSGEDIHASRLDRLISVHFENASREIEQGLRNSNLALELFYDAEAMIRGARAVDVDSPNREALHKLMLDAIEAVTMTENRDGFNDAELAQILVGLPNPDQVPLIQPQTKQGVKPAETQKVTLATSLLASGDAGRSLLLQASFDIEALGMNLIKQVVDMGLDHEESCMLRTVAVRICELNSPIMSYLSEDDMVSLGEVRVRLNRGALGLPEGVVAA